MFGNARLCRIVARTSVRSVGVNRQQPTVRTETHDISFVAIFQRRLDIRPRGIALDR